MEDGPQGSQRLSWGVQEGRKTAYLKAPSPHRVYVFTSEQERIIPNTGNQHLANGGLGHRAK